MQKNIGDGRDLSLYPLLQAAHGAKTEAVEGVFIAQTRNNYPAAKGISQCLAWSHFDLPPTGMTGAP